MNVMNGVEAEDGTVGTYIFVCVGSVGCSLRKVLLQANKTFYSSMLIQCCVFGTAVALGWFRYGTPSTPKTLT
jgi:hypothetical protein